MNLPTSLLQYNLGLKKQSQLLQKRIGSRKIRIALLLTLMKGEFKSPSEQVGGTQSIVRGD
jgi:hypothetical protein